jgi:hypothetical protein
MMGDENGKRVPDNNSKNNSIVENLTLTDESNPTGVLEDAAVLQEYRPVVTPEMFN